MNKFLYSLIISIFIFVFAGCETEGEDIDMRFETCTVSFVQQELRSSYEVYFNGEKSINRSSPPQYVPSYKTGYLFLSGSHKAAPDSLPP